MKAPLQDSIIKLVSEQLSPLVSWHVRRKIHKNANLQQEYQDYLSLWQEIKGENTMETREELNQEILRNTIAREKKSEHKPSSTDSSAMLPWTRLGISIGVCLGIATFITVLTPARYEATGTIQIQNSGLSPHVILEKMVGQNFEYDEDIKKIVAERHSIHITPELTLMAKDEVSQIEIKANGENPELITDYVNTYIEPTHLVQFLSEQKIVDSNGKAFRTSQFTARLARIPILPKSPNKAMMLTIGFVVGILLGFLWVAKS
jgi:hypothetical protein